MDKLYAAVEGFTGYKTVPRTEIRTTVAGLFGTSEPEKVQQFVREQGFVGSSETLVAYEEISQWSRAGGETYQAVSRIQTTRGVKYVVGKSVTSSDNERGNSMLSRRTILQEAGVSIPELFHTEMSKDGQRAVTFFERFFPGKEDLLDIVGSTKKSLPEGALKEIGRTGAILDQKGFHPLNYIREFIFDKDSQQVYMVDFGSDLGGPGEEPTTTSLRTIKEQFKKKPDEMRVVLEAYHATKL